MNQMIVTVSKIVSKFTPNLYGLRYMSLYKMFRLRWCDNKSQVTKTHRCRGDAFIKRNTYVR